MNNDWLDFLIQQNAHMENNRVEHFGNKDAEIAAPAKQTVLCDLGNMGFIRAEGAEAQAFLQNQLSNDVNQVTAQQSQLSAYCTAKGRVLTLFRLLQRDDQYLLLLPKERLAETLKRLNMYVLMTKVSLQDASDQLVAIGLAGHDADALLKTQLQTLPEHPDAATYSEGLIITKVAGQLPRYLIIGEVNEVSALWNQLKAQSMPCSYHVWSYLDITAGIPQVYQQNVEAFVPQMMNLHSINAVSFQKGCYPGQEVVARMHFLGKLKRRMYLAHADTTLLPNPGDTLHTENDDSDQGVGRVVDARFSPKGGVDLLVVLQIASAENAAIHLGSPNGVALNFKDLPYAVELEREGK